MNKYFKISLFITAIFIILFSVIYYIQSKKTSRSLCVIKASKQLTKKKPEEPGGLIIPNSESLLYKKSQFNPKNVVLLPYPEEFMPIKRSSNNISDNDSIDDILDNLEYYEKFYQEEEAKDNNPLLESDLILPNILSKKISQAEGEFEGDLESAFSDVELDVKKSTDKRFNPHQKSSKVSSGYKLQLSAAFTQNSAEVRWKKIQKKYYKLLADKQMLLEKVQGSNGKIFYLIMTGYFETKSDAQKICRMLIDRNQGCRVIK